MTPGRWARSSSTQMRFRRLTSSAVRPLTVDSFVDITAPSPPWVPTQAARPSLPMPWKAVASCSLSRTYTETTSSSQLFLPWTSPAHPTGNSSAFIGCMHVAIRCLGAHVSTLSPPRSVEALSIVDVELRHRRSSAVIHRFARRTKGTIMWRCSWR